MEVNKEFYKRLDDYIDSLSDKKNDFKILSFVLDELGEIPNEIKGYISEKIGVLPTTLDGTLKFYPKFKDKNKNYLKICTGKVCKKKGVELYKELSEYLQLDKSGVSKDGKFIVSTDGCLGKCLTGPNYSLNGRVYNYKEFKDIKKRLENI
ncbi:MAG: NAD(P)H-dependent oxidoreductase subunit E [Cetobacterium sp.]|uniref:NAD(P)H-dependent oxidoreductase subunit E n=1 Tax=Cetobacterium sp. TaxID=2071632 RepID=UPI002FC5C187